MFYLPLRNFNVCVSLHVLFEQSKYASQLSTNATEKDQLVGPTQNLV